MVRLVTKELTVTASNTAESGQVITIQTSTTYEVYFTVEVRLISLFEVYTRDSPRYGVPGSPIIQNSYSVYVQEVEGRTGLDYILYMIVGLVIAVVIATFILVRRRKQGAKV